MDLSYKKGGKIKRKKAIKKPKKRVVKPKKKTGFISKDAIFTQPAFQMFGYKLPYTNVAPAKPIDEEAYKKASELLQQAQKEKEALDRQRQELENLRNQQLVPVGMPAVMPDYDELNQRLLMNEEKQQRLEEELRKNKSSIEDIYQYGGKLVENIENVKAGREKLKEADKIIESQEALKEKRRLQMAKAREAKVEKAKIIKQKEKEKEIKKKVKEDINKADLFRKKKIFENIKQAINKKKIKNMFDEEPQPLIEEPKKANKKKAKK